LNSRDISQLREEYSSNTLNRNGLNVNPFKQFEQWLNNAYDQNIKEPNAMCVSTVNQLKQPSSRMVLLRGFDEEGFIFYSNYLSKKGTEISKNASVALLFFWANLQQQIRIEGIAQKISNEQSDQYFHSRPVKSQAASKASPQSQVIDSRKILESWYENASKEADIDHKLERPNHWGGYQIKPNLFEFWQGRPSRLHDRFQYVLNQSGEWVIQRLAP